jgi:hypothetical protein
MNPDEPISTATGRVPSQDTIAEIIADSSNPSLRNLRITQCYSELSRTIAAVVGSENVNWCTFATWASKTAGRFIRLNRLDEHVRNALQRTVGAADWIKTARDTLDHIPGVPVLGDEIVIKAAGNIAADISAEVAAGNLAVFTELAPLFSAMVSAAERIKAGERSALNGVRDSLRPGPTSQGGQDLLRQAVADYLTAAGETDPRRKAEVMLRANAQVGAHEQIRLQDYILKAMRAPLGDAVVALIHRKFRGATASLDPLGLSAMLDTRLRPLRTALDQVWLQVSTEYLMTLELPNGTLHLGRDLPNASGQPIFPPNLVELQDAELVRILRIYHADGISARGSAAEEWSNLSDRLRYIFELFRSRQQDASLFEPPFGDVAMAAIHRGTVPLLGV